MPDCDLTFVPTAVYKDIAYYYDENGYRHKADDVREIKSQKTYLDLPTGWYIAEGNVSIDEGVDINGDVNLILADSARFT